MDNLQYTGQRANFIDEIHHRGMRTTVNQLRNERLAKGQYTDAADDMLLKLFWHKISQAPRLSRGLEKALEGHITDNAPQGASNGSANCIADSWQAP